MDIGNFLQNVKKNRGSQYLVRIGNRPFLINAGQNRRAIFGIEGQERVGAANADLAVLANGESGLQEGQQALKQFVGLLLVGGQQSQAADGVVSTLVIEELLLLLKMLEMPIKT